MSGPVRRVLGVDPGTRVTGWGVVEQAERGPRLVACGTIRLPEAAPIAERLARIHAGLRAELRTHAPDAVAVEEAFAGVNARSAIRLGEARAVCLLAATAEGRAVHELPPALVKKAVAGHGRAGKETVRTAVMRALGLAAQDGPPPPYDASDALALALTALVRLSASAALAPGTPIGRRPGRGRRRRWTAEDVADLLGPAS